MGLTYETRQKLDSKLVYTDDCDEYLKVDWRVFAKATSNAELYSKYTTEDDVYAKIVFSESICVPLSVGMIILIIFLVLLFIAIIVIVICCICRKRRIGLFKPELVVMDENEASVWTRKSEVEYADRNKKQKKEIKKQRKATVKLGPVDNTAPSEPTVIV